MNLKLLIDGIVRQTTVLLAQLSTASGVRSPLAHVADQVFLELAREIEAQGVRRQVVADMFGMALRSYQKKMNRLTESVSVRKRTLWEAMLEFVEHEQPTRARAIERFRHDGEREVAAVSPISYAPASCSRRAAATPPSTGSRHRRCAIAWSSNRISTPS